MVSHFPVQIQPLPADGFPNDIRNTLISRLNAREITITLRIASAKILYQKIGAFACRLNLASHATSCLLATALCSLIFLLSAVNVLKDNVALYHDAVWDFIPAVAMIRSESIEHSYEVGIFHHRIPIVTSPYSGALKTWILAPIIKLLPLSPGRILTINVLFGFLYLLALYWALLPLAGKIWASIAFLVPFVDTNFLITAPVDAGIDLTQYIFIALALGTFSRFTSTREMKHYSATFFMCGCILAQKLTALPVVIGILFVLILVSFKQFLENVRTGAVKRAVRSYILIPAVLFIAPLMFQIYYFWQRGFSGLKASTADGTFRPYFAALRFNFIFFFTSFDGWDWYRRLTLDARDEMVMAPYLAILGLSIIALSLVIYFLSSKGRRTGRDSALSLLIGSVSFLIYPAFRGLYRPWHFYILEPLFLFCLFLASRHLLDWSAGRLKYLVRIAVCAIAVFLISISTWHSSYVMRQYGSRKGVCIASTAFYDLYHSILRSHIIQVYAINYSIGYPIYVLSKGEVRVDDLAFAQLTPEKVKELIWNVKQDPDAAIVYRHCGCRDSEPQWVGWLNRDAELPAFIKSLGNEAGEIGAVRFWDNRQTEFVVISQKGRPII